MRLTPELSDELPAGLAHQVGACAADGTPQVVRALGLVEEDDGRLSVLLSALANPELLRAVRDTGRVAVVTCRATTLHTVQYKGADATVEAAENPRYRRLLQLRGDAFWADIEQLGFDRASLSGWYDVPPDALVRICFTPSGAWNGTPGPGSGAPLELLP
jgi:hypothetical protein